VQSGAVPFRGFRVGRMLRARAATSRGVGPAANAGVVAPRCRCRTGYWLPRCGGRQRLEAVFHASSAVRRVSSPSKIPPLQGWTVSTRPERVRAGPEIALPRRRSSGFLSWGFKDAPPSISARRVRSRWLSSRDDARLRPEKCHLLRRLPPVPFLPASTVCSAARLAGSALPGSGLSFRRIRSRRRFSCNRPWGSCRFGACCFCPPVSRSVLVPLGARTARIVSQRAAFAGASPVMPYPSKLLPSSAAVPSSPTGDTFSPLQVAALVVTAVANHDDDSAGGCRPQGLDPLPKSVGVGRCCQRPRPDAPLGLLLERAGGRCFREC
jgi:hypothetical protein